MSKFVSRAKRATHVALLPVLSATKAPDMTPPPIDLGFKAVPILTGSTGYFTRVTAGQYSDSPTFSPLLLAPVGDKWLVEAKGVYFSANNTNHLLATTLGPTGGVR